MNRFTSLLLALSLVLAGPDAIAQTEQMPFMKRVFTRLVYPPANRDTAAVWQPRPRWNVTLSGELRQTGVSQTHSTVSGGIPIAMESRLQERLYTGAGAAFGFGGWSFGLSRQIGRSALSSKSNSFEYCGTGLGLSISYFDIHQPIEYTLTLGSPDTPVLGPGPGTTASPGRMKMVIGETVYAFNRRDFALNAVYKGNKLQRRSAGSWMLSAKYVQGEVSGDHREKISDAFLGVYRQATAQASVGGGYSYNFVVLHHQGASDVKGLRNLTFNLSGMPLVTLYDRHVVNRAVTDPVTGKVTADQSYRLKSTLRLNYVARAGAGFAWDRFFLSATGQYDIFSFRGETEISGTATPVKVKTAGRFSKWSTVFKLNVRF